HLCPMIDPAGKTGYKWKDTNTSYIHSVWLYSVIQKNKHRRLILRTIRLSSLIRLFSAKREWGLRGNIGYEISGRRNLVCMFDWCVWMCEYGCVQALDNNFDTVLVCVCVCVCSSYRKITRSIQDSLVHVLSSCYLLNANGIRTPFFARS